jgi:hypothetical protein
MSIRPSPPAPTQPSRQKEGSSSSGTEYGADMLASILGLFSVSVLAVTESHDHCFGHGGAFIPPAALLHSAV